MIEHATRINVFSERNCDRGVASGRGLVRPDTERLTIAALTIENASPTLAPKGSSSEKVAQRVGHSQGADVAGTELPPRSGPKNRIKVVGHRESLLLSTAIVTLAWAALGARPASAQTVTSTGTVTPGSVQTPVWPVGGPLIVGDGANGTLTIANGGSVTDTVGTIGKNGATGIVTVSGTDGSGHASSWTNSSDVTIGSNGNGTLTIEDGGAVKNVKAHIGLNFGSSGEVDVSGAGSIWTSTNEIRVGENGTGTLTITDGASAASTSNGAYFWVGSGTTGVGTVTVSGVVRALVCAPRLPQKIKHISEKPETERSIFSMAACSPRNIQWLSGNSRAALASPR